MMMRTTLAGHCCVQYHISTLSNAFPAYSSFTFSTSPRLLPLRTLCAAVHFVLAALRYELMTSGPRPAGSRSRESFHAAMVPLLSALEWGIPEAGAQCGSRDSRHQADIKQTSITVLHVPVVHAYRTRR